MKVAQLVFENGPGSGVVLVTKEPKDNWAALSLLRSEPYAFAKSSALAVSRRFLSEERVDDAVSPLPPAETGLS